MSTGLSDDARRSYFRLRAHARSLATRSAAGEQLAESAARAYLLALGSADPERWIEVVRSSAMLLERAHALDGFVRLTAAEREAMAFFDAIVRENHDLLAAVPLAVA
jgi:hypothetical protein